MVLFKRLPVASLIEFCRVLRHNLSAGLSLQRVLRQQAERGPRLVRPVADRISLQIDQGESLEEALKSEKDYFPPIFVSLVIVGEQSGCLPEVLEEMEKYFLLQQKLQRQFISQISWPALQFIVAPFVVAGMIFLLAVLGSPLSPLGKTFAGTAGALMFLVTWWGTVALIVAAYFVITRTLRQRETVDRVLLRLPVIGPTVSAIALMRFCISLGLTTETGMSIVSALRLSMRATGNEAFAGKSDMVRDAVRSGEELSVALKDTGIFPSDFIDIMSNAEESGRLSAVLHHQAAYYEEEARRRMTILTRAASWGFYAGVACVLIFMIFRIFMSIYGSGGVYDSLLK